MHTQTSTDRLNQLHAAAARIYGLPAASNAAVIDYVTKTAEYAEYYRTKAADLESEYQKSLSAPPAADTKELVPGENAKQAPRAAAADNATGNGKRQQRTK